MKGVHAAIEELLRIVSVQNKANHSERDSTAKAE
jgi:hypothetical protein